MTGNHNQVTTGAVTLSCMEPTARDVMELALTGWAEHLPKMRETLGRDPDDVVRSFAYWLFRWSGLVNPLAEGEADKVRAELERTKKLAHNTAVYASEKARQADKAQGEADNLRARVDELEAGTQSLIRLMMPDRPLTEKERQAARDINMEGIAELFEEMKNACSDEMPVDYSYMTRASEAARNAPAFVMTYEARASYVGLGEYSFPFDVTYDEEQAKTDTTGAPAQANPFPLVPQQVADLAIQEGPDSAAWINASGMQKWEQRKRDKALAAKSENVVFVDHVQGTDCADWKCTVCGHKWISDRLLPCDVCDTVQATVTEREV